MRRLSVVMAAALAAALILVSCGSGRGMRKVQGDPQIAAAVATVSEDNYYFAVRALSPGGHPGLPVVAR